MNGFRNPLLWTLVVLQIGTLSLVLFMYLHPAARNGPAERTLVIESAQGGTKPGISPNEFRAELRSMVRAEVAAATVGTARGEAANTPLAAEDLQIQEQAIAASGAVIRQAIAARVWTRADTQALLPHIGKVPQQQRRALVEEFAAAVNRQELKLEDLPPL